MDVRSKIWLEINGEPVFGSGREDLLRAIDKTGSINKAAKDIKISYKKALSYIQTTEKRLGIKLVVRRTGGLHGGGATLTDESREFLRKYKLLEGGVNEMLNRKFIKIFGNGSKEIKDEIRK